MIQKVRKPPENIIKALEEFFKVSQGNLWNATAISRTKLAENISFVATGKKENPCYSIIDIGEGQTPKKMPDTFLSLSKSNKLRIPFVQGKFNMGGTGVFQFSGQNNLQLIVSKRDPKLLKLKMMTQRFLGFYYCEEGRPKRRKEEFSIYLLTIDG